MYRNLPPLSLCVLISAFLSLPVYASTTILPGETFENNGQINNFDAIDNYGYLINYGYIDSYSYPAPPVVTAEFNNWGVTDNFGWLGLHAYSTLNNYGSFNTDSMGGIGTDLNTQITNQGVFNNNGNLWNMSPPFSSVEMTPQIINLGTLNNSGSIQNVNLINAGNVNNSGSIETASITNQISGYINNLVSSVINVYGNLVNNGSIDNTGSIRLYIPSGSTSAEWNNSGQFNNAGTITAYGYILNNTGVFNNSTSAYGLDVSYINNSGQFNNGGMIINPIMDINNSGEFNSYWIEAGRFNNAPSGIFTNTNVAKFYAVDNQGVFNNQHELTLTGGYDPNPVLINGGQFNNNGSLVFYGDTMVDNYGEFNQSGMIDGGGGNMRLNNYGVFNNGSEFTFVPGLVLSLDSTLNNYGVFNNWSSLSVYGSVNNMGTYNSYGFDYNNIGGLTNSGEMNLRGDFRIESFVNEISGVVNYLPNNISHEGLVVDQGFYNAGIINNSAKITINNANYLVPAVNSGTINNVRDMVTGYSTEMTINSYFDNTGKINNHSGFISMNGWSLNNSGEIANGGVIDLNTVFNNAGLINNSGRMAITDSSFYEATINSGIINNYSDASSAFYLDTDLTINAYFINTGSINNSRDARVSLTGLVTNSGIINNDGKMVIGSFSNQAIVKNTGTLDIVDWQMTNTGTISNAVDFTNYMTPVINIGQDMNNAGTINNSYGASINMFGWLNTNSGTITNDGMIEIYSYTPALVNTGIISGAGEFRGDLVITEAGTLAPGSLDAMMHGRDMTINGDLDLNGTLDINTKPETFPFITTPDPTNVNVYGFVTLGENSVLDFSFPELSYFTLGQTFDLMSAYDISGSFGSFYYDALFDNTLALQWEILEGYGMGDLLRVSVVSAVPVPAAIWLFLSGLAGLIVVSRRHEKTLH